MKLLAGGSFRPTLCVCVYVCVCVREREREREEWPAKTDYILLSQLATDSAHLTLLVVWINRIASNPNGIILSFPGDPRKLKETLSTKVAFAKT